FPRWWQSRSARSMTLISQPSTIRCGRSASTAGSTFSVRASNIHTNAEGTMQRSLLGIFVALALTGCSAGNDTKAAESAVAAFHRDMDAGKFAQIYDASAEDMKSSLSRDDFVKLLTALHEKLGPY